MAEDIFPFIALSIPIIGILAAVAMKWMKLKERQLEMQTSLSAEKAAQYAAHVERLEQRVRVLERIATDGSTALAQEINNLRDQPPN